MSILAVDYGEKKVGLAKSTGNTAVPLVILENKGRNDLLEQLKEVCQREEVEKIIVGIPLSLSTGKLREADLKNKQMQKVLGFIKDLKKQVSLPVETEDERLSTQMANGLTKGVKNKQDDDIAAMLILQNYLDKTGKG